LVVLKSALPQENCKLQNSSTLFSHARTATQGACVFWSKIRCASFYFERSCPERRPRAAL
jgi:hypothetical protein